jgi:hypothetical protein
VESGAGTRSGPLSGFDIRVLIEIFWIPSTHVSSVVVTVKIQAKIRRMIMGTKMSNCLLNLMFE